MKKFLEYISLTGADDNTSIEKMVELHQAYRSVNSFVEFAILLRQGEPKQRYPSKEWIQRLFDAYEEHPSMNIAGHVCGKYVRDICAGSWSIIEDYSDVWSMFSRIQLNFSPYTKDINHNVFLHGFDNDMLYFKQFIFQLKNINDPVFLAAKKFGVDCVPLFDLSGGRGITPETWPVSDCLCGYAGGLTPENVASQVELISTVSKDAWIDAESGLRTDNEFDLKKVESFIQNSIGYVKE